MNLTFNSAGLQSVSASSGAISGTQSGIVVNPGATQRLSLTGLTLATTGVADSFLVRALDAAGNTTPNYSGTVHVSSSDALAALPADFTFSSNNGGTRNVGVTFASSGNQSLTVTDTLMPSVSGSLGGIAVEAPAVRLRLLMAASTTAGASTPVTLQVTDNFNNLASIYTGTVVVTTSDAQASYASQLTFTSGDQGSKTLSGAFATAGTQTLTAVDTQWVLAARRGRFLSPPIPPITMTSPAPPTSARVAILACFSWRETCTTT